MEEQIDFIGPYIELRKICFKFITTRIMTNILKQSTAMHFGHKVHRFSVDQPLIPHNYMLAQNLFFDGDLSIVSFPASLSPGCNYPVNYFRIHRSSKNSDNLMLIFSPILSNLTINIALQIGRQRRINLFPKHLTRRVFQLLNIDSQYFERPKSKKYRKLMNQKLSHIFKSISNLKEIIHDCQSEFEGQRQLMYVNKR